MGELEWRRPVVGVAVGGGELDAHVADRAVDVEVDGLCALDDGKLGNGGLHQVRVCLLANFEGVTPARIPDTWHRGGGVRRRAWPRGTKGGKEGRPREVWRGRAHSCESAASTKRPSVSVVPLALARPVFGTGWIANESGGRGRLSSG